MATDAQTQANRRNAARSTGPITEEGKNRSRFNALKHGLRAQIPILPGDDPDAMQVRREAWVETAQPANAIELYLVESALAASFALDRARMRAADAAVAATEKEQAQEVQAAAPPPFQLDQANRELMRDPAAAVARFRQSAAGSAWLRQRWQQLKTALERRDMWEPEDVQMALRLLGRDPGLALRQDTFATQVLTWALMVGWDEEEQDEEYDEEAPDEACDEEEPDEACDEDNPWKNPLAQILYVDPFLHPALLTRLAEDLEDEAPETIAEARQHLEALVEEQLASLGAVSPTSAPSCPVPAAARPIDPLADPAAALRLRYTDAPRAHAHAVAPHAGHAPAPPRQGRPGPARREPRRDGGAERSQIRHNSL